MNVVRVLLFLYIIATPILLIGMVYLSVRTRYFTDNLRWFRNYVLPSLLLFVLLFANFAIVYKLFPSTVGHIHISCVSQGDIEQDISEPLTVSFVGLIEVHDLDYIDKADVFEPMIVGYVNELYYEYSLVREVTGSIYDNGLLRVMENQPAFLSEDYPCAALEHGERLDAGVYMVHMDTRSRGLDYVGQWYDEAYPLYSFELIEHYDVDLSYDFQDVEVKAQVEDLLGNGPLE